MNWLSKVGAGIGTAWNIYFKKDVVKQDRINPMIVEAFAKMLADAIKFDKILNGKFAWFERYDEFVIRQIVNLFVVVFGGKAKQGLLTSVEQFMVYYTDGNYDKASYIMAHEINREMKPLIPKNAQDLIVHRQLSLLFEVSLMYLNPDVVNNKGIPA